MARRVTFASPISERVEYEAFSPENGGVYRPIALTEMFLKRRKELMDMEIRFPLRCEEVAMYRVGFSHCVIEWAKQQNEENLAKSKEILGKKRKAFMEPLKSAASPPTASTATPPTVSTATPTVEKPFQEVKSFNNDPYFAELSSPSFRALASSASSPIASSTPNVNAVLTKAAKPTPALPTTSRICKQETPTSTRIKPASPKVSNTESPKPPIDNKLLFPSFTSSAGASHYRAATPKVEKKEFESAAFTTLRRSSIVVSPTSSDDSSTTRDSTELSNTEDERLQPTLSFASPATLSYDELSVGENSYAKRKAFNAASYKITNLSNLMSSTSSRSNESATFSTPELPVKEKGSATISPLSAAVASPASTRSDQCSSFKTSSGAEGFSSAAYTTPHRSTAAASPVSSDDSSDSNSSGAFNDAVLPILNPKAAGLDCLLNCMGSLNLEE